MILISCLISCDSSEGNKVNFASLSELVEHCKSEYQISGGQMYDSRENPMDTLAVFSYYNKDGDAPDFSSETVSEYAVYLDDSSYAGDTEIGVFKLQKGVDKEQFLSFFRARVSALIDRSVNYPFDTSALTSAKFGTTGEYVYYVIVRDHSADVEKILKTNLAG